MKHVVIIGGGFGGVNLIKNLANEDEFAVTLVDRNNYNFFPPLLYQIATGFLDVSNISYPFRKLIRKMHNIRFQMGELLKVDLAANRIFLSSGELSYDYLVIATGAATNYFGMEQLKKNALPMKNVNDATNLRNHLLLQMEKAAILPDGPERDKYLTIVVAGGGPTGVEVSGMLADIKNHIFPKDYPEIGVISKSVGIYLVDGAEVVLKPMSTKSQEDALNNLTDMGVKLKLQTQVKDYDGETITFTNGESIAAKTLVWAAGVSCQPIDGIPRSNYGRGSRLIVDAFNQLGGISNVYAIGDCCIQNHEELFPGGHPQLAQPAIQQGRNLAENLKQIADGQTLVPFSYWDKGTMAIIGRNKAVVDLPDNKIHFNGFIAWFMWVFIHLVSLITVRNKFTTLLNWIGAYLTKDQSLRMIIRPQKPPQSGEW